MGSMRTSGALRGGGVGPEEKGRCRGTPARRRWVGVWVARDRLETVRGSGLGGPRHGERSLTEVAGRGRRGRGHRNV